MASSIPLLQNSEAVKHLTGEELNDTSKPLDQQISDLFASVGNAAYREGFGEVELNRYGVDGIINHKPNRSKVLGIAAIKEVIEKGHIIKTNLNWKGRGYDSYMIAAPVEIGDTTVYVAAVVNRDQGTNKFYLDEVVDQNGNYINIKNEAPGNTKTGVAVRDGVTRGPRASSNGIIRQTEGNGQEKSSGRASVEVSGDPRATQRLKEAQFELIQKNHPKEEWDYQTWINSVDDVKTYQEAVDHDRAGTPDFDDADIDRTLQTGRVLVYSSHRIRPGTFVTPSRMEAENYAGSTNVYSKTVPLTDVAWIDSLQGQYAPTSTKSGVKYSGRASTQVESREYAELRREYERRTKAWNEANSRNDESFPFASELRWITEAEKRMNEMKEAGATRKRRTVSNTRRDIMKLFSTDKANRRDMEQLINRQIGEMMDSGEITAAALDRVVGELLEAGSVVSSSKNSPWIDETFERIRSDLSGTKLYVSEKTWGDFSKDDP